jgi:hypothetical protein
MIARFVRPFTRHDTTDEVSEGIDLTGMRAIVTVPHPRSVWKLLVRSPAAARM